MSGSGRLGLVLLWLVLPIVVFGSVPPLFGVRLLHPRREEE